MKNLLLFILIAGLATYGFGQKSKKKNKRIGDNVELMEIYKNDQNDRRSENIDWEIVSKRDSLREVRVYELLEEGKVRTSKDYQNAAMIFQHGRDTTAYGMAVKLMKKSIELDPNANKWLLAAATDRYLMSKGEPQIYGTQFQKSSHDAPWKLGEMDTTKITDAERIEFRVGTLAQQRQRVKQMNMKSISELLSQGKNIDEVVEFIKTNHKTESAYDLSENAVNNFGYDLLDQKKNDEALKIFKLNTELHPNASNPWDSYGECLMLMGEKEEAIKAYKKSLDLNPNNTNARNIIRRNK